MKQIIAPTSTKYDNVFHPIIPKNWLDEFIFSFSIMQFTEKDLKELVIKLLHLKHEIIKQEKETKFK